jgi:hypothetical protein
LANGFETAGPVTEAAEHSKVIECLRMFIGDADTAASNHLRVLQCHVSALPKLLTDLKMGPSSALI